MCSFVSGGFAAVLQGRACRRRCLQRVPEESALLHSRRRCSHRQPMSSHAVAFSPPQPLVVAAAAGGRRTVAVLLEPCGKYPPCRVCRFLVLLLCFPSFFFRSVLVCFTVFVFFIVAVIIVCLLHVNIAFRCALLFSTRLIFSVDICVSSFSYLKGVCV